MAKKLFKHGYVFYVNSTDLRAWSCPLVGTYDGDNLILSIYSIRQTTTDGTNGVLDTDNFTSTYIGKHPTAGLYFDGTIGETIVLNRAWSAIEIKNYYEITRRKYGI